MPRAGQIASGPNTRLPQRVALGVLVRSFPPAQVDLVLDAAGRREQRQRLLPARLMVYFTLGMWIFNALSYEEILAEILRDIPGLAHGPADETASAAAIGRARRRLGVEPLRLLFEQAAGSAATKPGPASVNGWRSLRLNRLEIDVPGTPANREEFAALSTLAGAAAPPARARLLMLTEDGTRRIAAAQVASAADALPERLLGGALGGDSLLIMDDRPFSAALWNSFSRLGAEQLWPLADQVPAPAGARLPDGSQLCRLPDGADGGETAVRVVYRTGPGVPNRLATSILDHRAAPSSALISAYDRYRGGGFGVEGIRAYRSGDRLVLRSKDPELVRQEVYAMLCVHHAIGELVGFAGPGLSAGP
jgi:hypothetical protein